MHNPETRKFIKSATARHPPRKPITLTAEGHGGRREIIQRAIFAALGCTKIDYRSALRMDEAAEQIARFVEAALDEAAPRS